MSASDGTTTVVVASVTATVDNGGAMLRPRPVSRCVWLRGTVTSLTVRFVSSRRRSY